MTLSDIFGIIPLIRNFQLRVPGPKSRNRPYIWMRIKSDQKKLFKNQTKSTPDTARHQMKASQTTFPLTVAVRGPPKGF